MTWTVDGWVDIKTGPVPFSNLAVWLLLITASSGQQPVNYNNVFGPRVQTRRPLSLLLSPMLLLQLRLWLRLHFMARRLAQLDSINETVNRPGVPPPPYGWSQAKGNTSENDASARTPTRWWCPLGGGCCPAMAGGYSSVTHWQVDGTALDN